MPTHGSGDRRFGKLGDSRRRDDGHIVRSPGKGPAVRRDSDIDLSPPEEPYRSTNVPVVGVPGRPVTNDRR